MGLLYRCPACGEVCEHSILTVDDDDHSEHLMLECTQCGHEWFGTFCKDEPKLKHRTKCPKCGSEELDTTCCQRDDDSMTEKVFCTACGHLWREGYEIKLVAITDEHDTEELS